MSDQIRSRLTRLASTYAPGSAERRDLLAVLKQARASKSLWKPLLSQLQFPGWDLADQDFWGTRTVNKSGLDAVWEKRFEIGQMEYANKPVTNRYGVSLTVRLKESAEGSFDANALMSWHGPGVFGGRSNQRKMYSHKVPGAFIGSGRRWQVSPDLVRGVQANFKKVERDILAFVQEDIEEHANRPPTWTAWQ